MLLIFLRDIAQADIERLITDQTYKLLHASRWILSHGMCLYQAALSVVEIMFDQMRILINEFIFALLASWTILFIKLIAIEKLLGSSCRCGRFYILCDISSGFTGVCSAL